MKNTYQLCHIATLKIYRIIKYVKYMLRLLSFKLLNDSLLPSQVISKVTHILSKNNKISNNKIN